MVHFFHPFAIVSLNLIIEREKALLQEIFLSTQNNYNLYTIVQCFNFVVGIILYDRIVSFSVIEFFKSPSSRFKGFLSMTLGLQEIHLIRVLTRFFKCSEKIEQDNRTSVRVMWKRERLGIYHQVFDSMTREKGSATSVVTLSSSSWKTVADNDNCKETFYYAYTW